MIRYALVPVVALVVMVTPGASPAKANVARISASLYPSGSRITYVPTISNASMDCQWGFFCDGNLPVFHAHLEDQLRRVGGWAQYAAWHHNRQRMQFAVYGSQYAAGLDAEGHSWSQAAFDDFRVALRAQGYSPLTAHPLVLPQGMRGGAVSALQRNGPDDLVAMAAWSGSGEVEAVAIFSHRSPAAQRIAVGNLARQVWAAISS